MRSNSQDTLAGTRPGGMPPTTRHEAASKGGSRRSPADACRANHRVKSWPHLFEATRLGLKTHELRRDTDRDYRAGDLLTLREFEPASRTYTGRELIVRITYVTSARNPCALSEESLDPGYCILSVTRDLIGTDGA